MTAPDKRLHAYRSDIADISLKGQVLATKFVKGRPARIAISHAGLRAQLDVNAGQTTQLLLGDDVLVFDEANGWVWVQAERDGYVGYTSVRAIEERTHALTHTVVAPRTFVYPQADLKLPRAGELSMGSSVSIRGFAETRGTRYAITMGNEAIIASHLRPLGEHAADFVSVAETLIYTPYLWGGCTGFGIDCSGLVQLSMRLAGRDVLRDSDMQASSIGEPIEPGSGFSGLQRGDLVFWKGHVAIMTDPETMVHASGHTMMVSREGLKDAIERIGYLYGGPTAFRRP